MKFTKQWKKLNYPIFTTIRQDKGYYKVGQRIEIRAPRAIFYVEIVSIREMIQDDITDVIAFWDADCTKDEFDKLLYRFYKDNVGDLILLTLMRI